jgi:hypothetical protein
MAKALEGIGKGLPRPDDEAGQPRVLDVWLGLAIARQVAW